jgi:DNA-binding MarR family transcriptional regulator
MSTAHSAPRWLNDDEQRAWRQLAALTQRLNAALDAQLQHDAELTHFSYFVLAMLSEAPNRALRMSQLAAASSSSPSRLSHTVRRLEERGWVARCRSSDDGRGQIARLTDEGWAKIVEAAPGHVEQVRKLVFDGLTTQQVGQLEAIAGAIMERVDGACGTDLAETA